MGNRGKNLCTGREVNEIRGDRGAPSPDRTGQAHASTFMRAGWILFEADERAEAWNEHRRGGTNAVTPKHPDMAHLMDIDRQDHPHRKFPAPERPVNTHRKEHREK